jgi:Nucleotide hydrolase
MMYSPGGCLKPGVSELDGLKQKLTRRLAPRGVSLDWEVVDLISVWWRPSFESPLVG